MQALGYLALTKDEFMDKISAFYMFQTGLGMNLLIMTVMSFIVGLSISGQTFYTFVLENLEKFGALKAIGAKSRELIGMILFQATFMALTGYGLGIGLCALVIYARQDEPARLRRDDHLVESRLAFVMVDDHRRRFRAMSACARCCALSRSIFSEDDMTPTETSTKSRDQGDGHR